MELPSRFLFLSFFDASGTEPRASLMLSKSCMTELHPQPWISVSHCLLFVYSSTTDFLLYADFCFFFEVLGIERRAFHVLGKLPLTELLSQFFMSVLYHAALLNLSVLVVFGWVFISYSSFLVGV